MGALSVENDRAVQHVDGIPRRVAIWIESGGGQKKCGATGEE